MVLESTSMASTRCPRGTKKMLLILVEWVLVGARALVQAGPLSASPSQLGFLAVPSNPLVVLKPSNLPREAA